MDCEDGPGPPGPRGDEGAGPEGTASRRVPSGRRRIAAHTRHVATKRGAPPEDGRTRMRMEPGPRNALQARHTPPMPDGGSPV